MGFSVVSGQINNIKHIDRNWLGQAKSLCTPEDSADFGLDNIEAEINLLEHELQYEYKQQEIGFCHNDLQYGNIMIDEDTNAITIIVKSYRHIFLLNTFIFFSSMVKKKKNPYH